MHWFQYWPLDHLIADVFKLVTWIDTGIATLSWIVLLVLLVGIELVSSSTRVTSVKSAKPLGHKDNRTHRSDQGYLGPIKISRQTCVQCFSKFYVCVGTCYLLFIICYL